METTDTEKINRIIKKHVIPFVKDIDTLGYYPESFLRETGKAGLLNSSKLTEDLIRKREIGLIEQAAKHCMTSAFLLWCQLAAIASLRLSHNSSIKDTILPLLESGEGLAGPGLSNGLKFYAGVEPIRLQAVRTEAGYRVTGSLPSVSNLDQGNWLTILASVNENRRIMGILPVQSQGLSLKEKTGFIGMNGTKTNSCSFDQVFLPDKWVITEESDVFIEKLRPTLVLYQIPLGIGVSSAALTSMYYARGKMPELQYLKVQPEELERDVDEIRKRIYCLADLPNLPKVGKEMLLTRLDVVHVTSKAVYGDMLFSGGRAYLKESSSFRRLRESYFLVNLTPTLKQLEKLKGTIKAGPS
ncbi:acyl-CoA/acyl-ACP dehydrogenase [Heyndrickxia acidicola]|uniref:Acyl-CoA/acyl-ACP dehydrogenase n=1 Tax=Heyndrickxia acidicola TaxID=209389 RepID=A0ABU6MQP4_9BACI|nr:acyl-CoA/acyl-ACP dehydrogenase [Heyndrickxia acidicola]MED1205547.1 acyl-CoA/acyl-ACP dehydrogenase [Heyndrickxia acidicola]